MKSPFHIPKAIQAISPAQVECQFVLGDFRYFKRTLYKPLPMFVRTRLNGKPIAFLRGSMGDKVVYFQNDDYLDDYYCSLRTAIYS